MIEDIITALRVVADIFIAGGVIVAVLALAFEPLLTGRRK